MLLRPQHHELRTVRDLSGIWTITFGEDDRSAGVIDGVPIAVPASWNDQLPGGRTELGPAWYECRFTLDGCPPGHRRWFRFGSVNYLAEVFLDGVPLGAHEGGHLPFAFELPADLPAGEHRLVVRVDGRVLPHHVPGGGIPSGWFGMGAEPPTQFDFFPYCGIHRRVELVTVPDGGIDAIRVDADPAGITVAVEAGHPTRLRLRRGEDEWTTEGTRLEPPDPQRWAPGSPNLYELVVEAIDGARVVDRYRLAVGLRSFRVDGDRLLLNGEPVFLRGFGRHEDAPVIGRGECLPVSVADHHLMAWCGANSYRTTHYPYAEEQLDLADRMGFLVIDEIPAVSLVLGDDHDAHRLEVCQQMATEMILRDRNHPSVVMWSVANEPFVSGDTGGFYGELYRHVRDLDPTRPVIHTLHQWGADDAAALSDVICTNRYEGWYSDTGRLDTGLAGFGAALDELRERYGKPVMVTEFGADTIEGHHAISPEVFSEEFQRALIEGYLDVIDERPWVVGAHVWNLADFATGQSITRMGGLNRKGVFTRDRRPKAAAFSLRDRWGG